MPQSLLETLRKLWRHRWVVFACTAAAFAASLATALELPSYYRAEAEVQIGVPEPRAFLTDETSTPLGTDDEKVEDERVAMLSRGVAQSVVDRLHLATDPAFAPRVRSAGWLHLLNPARYLLAAWPQHWPIGPTDWMHAPASESAQARNDRVVDALLADVDVSRIGRSDVLAIDAEAHRPALAAAIANTWANVYLHDDRNDKLQNTDRVQQYLADRVSQLRRQAAASDQAVMDYRRRYGLYRADNAVGENVTSQQLTELNTQLILAQAAKSQADAKLRDAIALGKSGADDASNPAVLDSRMIQTLKEEQAKAEQHLANLATLYGDRHPKIIAAKAAVADIRRKLNMEIARTITGLRNEAQIADIRFETLLRSFDALQNRMGQVNEKSIGLEALERDAAVNRSLLQAMLQRVGEIMGRQELEQADAKLISDAAVPLSPAFPPKRLLVLLGSLGGLLLGMLGALARDGVDSTFRRTEDVVAATGLPLIALVPTVEGRWPPSAHVLRRPISSFSESLRKIYIGLLLAEAAHPPKSVLLCSSTPDEGKSVLAASLARLLASSGKRVLVIDGDWRDPTLHRIFQCSNKKGLASVLTKSDSDLSDLIFTDPLSGADVLVAGGWTPGGVDKLLSDRMHRIVTTFAAKYDLVIIDSAPVLVGAEALRLARMVDKTLFIVRWGHTRRVAVLDAVRQLVDAHANLAGIAFARVDPKRYRQFAYGNLNYEYAH